MSRRLMADPNDICPKCSRTRQSSASGRLTQWFFVCRCSGEQTERIEEYQRISLCQKCGKRIETSRPGSFTQWIFGPNRCSCDIPQSQAAEAPGHAVDDAPHRSQKAPDQRVTENAIDVDAAKFPADRYTPLAILGRSHNGIVYSARDRLLNREVAIKTLTMLQTDEQLVQFQQEAKLTSQLEHENLIQVFDFGVTSGGVPFLVLEYFRGQSLADYISGHGPVELSKSIEILVCICDGLDHAHQRGIVHRDLKSENVLIAFRKDNSLLVKLIDFGLASAPKLKDYSDEKGEEIMGTPPFMSPEQVLGQSIDSRSDIYSLGCIFFQLVTGRLPFESESAMSTMFQQVKQTPPSIRQLCPNIEQAEQIDAVLVKALAKEAASRYQSAGELKMALQSLVAPKGNLATTLTGSFLANSDRTRSRNGFWTAVVVCLGVSVSAMLLYFSQKQMVVEVSKQHIDLKNTSPDLLGLPNITGNDDTDIRTSRPKTRFESAQRSNFHVTHLNGKLFVRPVSYLVEDDTLRELQDRERFPSVENLNLRDCDLTGSGLQFLAGRKIDDLDMSSTPLTGASLQIIGRITTLRTLTLNRVGLPGSAYKELRHLTNLRRLSLSESGITDEGVEGISRLRNLRDLELSNNPKITDISLSFLKTMPYLNFLGLNKSGITSGGLAQFGITPSIRELELIVVPINDDDLMVITKLPLTSLTISAGHFTKKGVKQLYSMKQPFRLTIYCAADDELIRMELLRWRPSNCLLKISSGE